MSNTCMITLFFMYKCRFFEHQIYYLMQIFFGGKGRFSDLCQYVIRVRFVRVLSSPRQSFEVFHERLVNRLSHFVFFAAKPMIFSRLLRHKHAKNPSIGRLSTYRRVFVLPFFLVLLLFFLYRFSVYRSLFFLFLQFSFRVFLRKLYFSFCLRVSCFFAISSFCLFSRFFCAIVRDF